MKMISCMMTVTIYDHGNCDKNDDEGNCFHNEDKSDDDNWLCEDNDHEDGCNMKVGQHSFQITFHLFNKLLLN